MKLVLNLAFAIVMLTISLSFIPDTPAEGDCMVMHSGTFKYEDDDDVKVVIDGKAYTEYHDNGKYMIKSLVKWVNDCECDVTMTKITVPDVPYRIGDVRHITINKVVGKEIYYTSTLNDRVREGKLIKVE